MKNKKIWPILVLIAILICAYGYCLYATFNIDENAYRQFILDLRSEGDYFEDYTDVTVELVALRQLPDIYQPDLGQTLSRVFLFLNGVLVQKLHRINYGALKTRLPSTMPPS